MGKKWTNVVMGTGDGLTFSHNLNGSYLCLIISTPYSLYLTMRLRFAMPSYQSVPGRVVVLCCCAVGGLAWHGMAWHGMMRCHVERFFSGVHL